MIYFREVQRLWIWVMLLLLLATPIIILTTTLHRIPANHQVSDRVLYAVYGPLALVAMLFSLGRLITEVRETALSIRFFLSGLSAQYGGMRFGGLRPLHIPQSRYGGWGVRSGFERMAYTVSGNPGVRIELKDGKEVLVGSQRADELARAIAERIGAPKGSAEIGS